MANANTHTIEMKRSWKREGTIKMNVEIVRYERYGVAAVTAAAAASLKEYETRARKRNKTH